jgi:putative heme-binding domain-containing protein
MRATVGCAALLGASVASPVTAQNPLSVSGPEADDSVEAELRSFTLAPGYEISLFADETDGVANPVCMAWDPAGRLWVLCTWIYPHPLPTEVANDRLLILTDTDADGRADETLVFADGLDMPTGFALGHGGAFVGQGNDLLHLKDTDGDDRADESHVVLTGFGTGDTHQNINSFTWSPGGELFFCQGLHNFSRVETPWGIRRLDEHGTWRLRPRRLELQGFRRTSGGGNPWGIVFAEWGEPFIKSNGPGISELLPGMVSTERIGSFWGGEMKIGETRVKSMIVELADSPHLADDIQGDMLIAGYFARDINRLGKEEDGSGHRLENRPSLVSSSHNAFRPVDIRIGPDGAIYIADWFNPIIGHYQASFRHPDRDKTHGRIWRLVASGRPLARAPAMDRMTAAALCEALASDWRYVRLQAKRRLADLPKAEVISAITDWVGSLDPKSPELEHDLYEALGVFESHEVVNEPLLKRLLWAEDHRARAYAARVVGRWHDRLADPLDLLAECVNDRHPRVRLEAVVACSDIREPRSMFVAAQASDHPLDRFLEHALTQTSHALAPYWRPALERGELRFARPENLMYVLRAYGGADVAAQLRGLLASETTSADGRVQALDLLARVGTPDDLRTVFDHAIDEPRLLRVLPAIAERRRVRPTGEVHTQLAGLLGSTDSAVRFAAARLSGLWQQGSLVTSIQELALREREQAEVRAAAILSLGELAPASSLPDLRPLIGAEHGPTIYLPALQAVSRLDLPAAATDGLRLISNVNGEAFGPILDVILRRHEGAVTLARALDLHGVAADDAKLISRWLSASGHDDVALIDSLAGAMGLDIGREAPFSEEFVRGLALEVRATGNSLAGSEVFLSSLASCTACHLVRGSGQAPASFQKGPELGAVGAGLSLELIIESVVWPQRQIKEGYEAMTILTDSGEVVSGFLTMDSAKTIGLRDLTTGELREFSVAMIVERGPKHSPMPSGFTNALTREELRDLIAYLDGLEGPGIDR